MRRLYFLLPDVATAQIVVNELLLARIEERHIHIIANENTSLEDLPEASLLQRSDFITGMERGIAVGGATGILAGLAALAFPGLVIAGGAVMATGLVGAGMGAWIGGMIGVDVKNTQLTQFEDAVNEGKLLALVDVPKDRIEEIQNLVKKHHSDVNFEGTEPVIPAFP